MTKSLLILGAVAVVALGAIFLFSQPQEEPAESPEGIQADEPAQEETTEETTRDEQPTAANVIVSSESGYVPAELTIQQGDTVTFRNETSREIWPATDIHPSHTLYPGSNRQNCGTPEGKEMFDACRGLEEGEEYSFVFNEAGTWRFHDHLRPSVTGAIIVEE